MTFVLNYIPSLGMILSLVLPIPFIVLKDDFVWWHVIAVEAGLILVQVNINDWSVVFAEITNHTIEFSLSLAKYWSPRS